MDGIFEILQQSALSIAEGIVVSWVENAVFKMDTHEIKKQIHYESQCKADDLSVRLEDLEKCVTVILTQLVINIPQLRLDTKQNVVYVESKKDELNRALFLSEIRREVEALERSPVRDTHFTNTGESGKTHTREIEATSHEIDALDIDEISHNYSSGHEIQLESKSPKFNSKKWLLNLSNEIYRLEGDR